MTDDQRERKSRQDDSIEKKYNKEPIKGIYGKHGVKE